MKLKAEKGIKGAVDKVEGEMAKAVEKVTEIVKSG